MRLALIAAAGAGVVVLVWWRGPDWGAVGNAFRSVRWEWVVLAILLNLVSVVARAFAWRTVIDQAIDKRYLLAERRKAFVEMQTPPCDTATCHACGAC